MWTRTDNGITAATAPRVYNIEVEDYHTYCVDYPGILVHNQNCGAERRSRVDSLEIRGKKELSDFIGRNPEAHRGKQA